MSQKSRLTICLARIFSKFLTNLARLQASPGWVRRPILTWFGSQVVDVERKNHAQSNNRVGLDFLYWNFGKGLEPMIPFSNIKTEFTNSQVNQTVRGLALPLRRSAGFGFALKEVLC